MLTSSEFTHEEIVRAGHYASLLFGRDEKFEVSVRAIVQETGKDLIFFFLTESDFAKWEHWKAHPVVNRVDSNGNVLRDANGVPLTNYVPEPQTGKIGYARTSIYKESYQFQTGNYVLVFDNTYSSITDKTVQFRFTTKWGLGNPVKALPIVELLESEIPKEVLLFLNKANQCYVAGHYEQSSVMLRKAAESAIRLKLLQSAVTEQELFDSEGNDLSLSKKIGVLKKHFLTTQKLAKDLDEIKWFGDIGAHGQMSMVQEDIRDRIEPKLRAFIMSLQLKQ